MNAQKTQILRGLGLLLALLFVAFSCVDLHRFSHDDQFPSDDCAVCILAHSQHQLDHFIPSETHSWEPKVFLTKVDQRVLFRNCEKISSQKVIYYFNKAPPVI
ncbi:MAG: hypothetical protein WBG71_11880 [Leeuwenhoekiella sp.]